MSRNNGEVRATVRIVDFTDVISATNRIEELQAAFAEKEQAANKARHELESYEENTRQQLAKHPELLAEFDAELADLARRREERTAREARIKALRK